MLKVDPSSFKAPYLPPSTIQEIVEGFRSKYWKSDNVPVDVYKIADFGLKLQVIPIPGLHRNPGIEALLLGDGSAIIVDAEQFDNDNFENRMRFSFAHEMGHGVMHSDLYKKFGCRTVEDWVELIRSIPENEYNWLEYQANEFAGQLLVPRNKLIEALCPFEDTIKKLYTDMGIQDMELISDYIAPRISKYFEVSDQVIARRINKEKLISF